MIYIYMYMETKKIIIKNGNYYSYRCLIYVKNVKQLINIYKMTFLYLKNVNYMNHFYI